MSVAAQPAPPRTVIRGGVRTAAPPVTASRPLVRLTTFAVLAGFGMIEWGKLIRPAPTARLLGLLGIALALVALGPLVRRYRRVLIPAIMALAFLLSLAVCGVPVRWIVHVRVAVTADWIGQGLQALPGIYIPYLEVDGAVKSVILMGAALLLLDGAFLLAFAPSQVGDLRRAGAAMPLVALAMVPATLVRPTFPYVVGLLLFLMLAAFVWGERVRRDAVGPLMVLCLLTGAVGVFLAGKIDTHSPWINYRMLSDSFGPGHIATFNWANQYGPLTHQWPRSPGTVLEVKARVPQYWKAQDLDQFDGTGWTTATYFQSEGLSRYVSASSRRKWTESIQVTLRAMNSTDVIAAGAAAQAPQDLPGSVTPGASPGTFTDYTELTPGTSYQITVYDPRPTASQLARAGVRYPPAALLQPYLTLGLPVTSSIGEPPQAVAFPPFGSGGQPENTSDVANYATGRDVIDQSPYLPAYQLARQLERGARTPYEYTVAVLRYLDSGAYTYNEDPVAARYPLLDFLFETAQGYCQHFAGAMALLLRMGGVPARVADGFTSGRYDGATREYDVLAKDAHAWVEAWFPRYGWVTFDPTPPSADPALGGSGSASGSVNIPGLTPLSKGALIGGRIRRRAVTAKGGAVAVTRHRGSSELPLLAVGGVLAALLLAALVLTHSPADPTEEALIAELERAMARAGRPISDDVTLAVLEDRFGSSTDAAAYVRALRFSRFAGRRVRPTRKQRRAVRHQLRMSLGLAGAIRALWALPPRWSIRRPCVPSGATG